MPKYLFAKTQKGIVSIPTDELVTFGKPYDDYGIVSAFAGIKAANYYDAIAEFKRLFPETEDEETIGDLIDEGVKDILELFNSFGLTDNAAQNVAKGIAGKMIAKCLGIVPSCMDAPDVLRQSVDRYRG